MQSVIPTLEPPKYGNKRKHTEIKEFYAILDDVKADLKRNAQAWLGEVKDVFKDKLERDLSAVLNESVATFEAKIGEEMSEELRIKIKDQFRDKLLESVNKIESETAVEEQINSTIDKAKVEFKQRTRGFKP